MSTDQGKQFTKIPFPDSGSTEGEFRQPSVSAQLRTTLDESSYKTLFDAAPIGMFRIALAGGTLLATNRALDQLLQLRDGNGIRTVGAYLTPAACRRARTLLRANGKLSDFETQLMGGNGAVHWVSISATLQVETGAVEGVVLDITESKKTEAALQYRIRFEELIARLSGQFANVPVENIDALLQDSIRQVGMFIQANRGYIVQLARQDTVFVYTHAWADTGDVLYTRTLRERPVALSPWLMQKLNKGEHIGISNVAHMPTEAQAEQQFLQSNLVGSAMMVPMVYSGALVGYLAFETVQKPRRWVDHTIRLLKMIGEIFSNALERIDIETALVTAREQASEAARIKSAFLANMSHEIRTPLTSILGFASLLDEELADPEHLEYVHLIRQSGRRLMDTLNSVLDLAQLESHGRTISLGIFNITDQVNEVMRLLHPLASDKHLSLELVSKNPNALAEIDQACMHRILHNLIGNAIKFTDQGGVLVTVDADGKHVYVQVRDTGIGMNDTFLPEVFEEFKQESGGLTRSYEGNGLGLAITKRLVDLMGGTINVKSEKGRGSTFTVSLAQVNYETFHDPVDWDSDPMGVQKPRVLVVENNWETRMLLEHMLKSAYVVDTVGEAEEAIRKATRITFDIVLMDINLGGKQTGVDVLQVMRQLPGYDRTVIIALTAYALPGDKERFLELGFNGYLGKPFARTELLRSLEDLLASR